MGGDRHLLRALRRLNMSQRMLVFYVTLQCTRAALLLIYLAAILDLI